MTLEERILKLEEIVNNNANVLRFVATATNIICEKLDIKNGEVKTILEKEIMGRASELLIRSEQSGTIKSDSRNRDNGLFNPPMQGDVSESKSESEIHNQSTGNVDTETGESKCPSNEEKAKKPYR